MDDGVLVEPGLGVRRWTSVATFETGLRKLMGEDALNLKKDEAEGRFATT